MDNAQPIRVKLSGQLRRIKEGATASPATPAPAPAVTPVQPAPVTLPAQPLLDLQALRTELSELTRWAKDVQAREKTAASDAAQLSVELGLAIAERLIGVQIAADRQRLHRIVADVLAKMPATRSVIIRGQSKDLALLQTQLAEHADWVSYKEMLHFRPDETGVRGRFKMESDDWFVEWDTQRSLAELRTALLEETFAEA